MAHKNFNLGQTTKTVLLAFFIQEHALHYSFSTKTRKKKVSFCHRFETVNIFVWGKIKQKHADRSPSAFEKSKKSNQLLLPSFGLFS